MNINYISVVSSLPQIDLGENLNQLPNLKEGLENFNLKEGLENFPSGGYLSLASILGTPIIKSPESHSKQC